MAYFAGMIWSVSMLAPNFQDLPRRTLGKLMRVSCRLCTNVGYFRGISRECAQTRWARSRDARGQVRQHLARVRDDARDRAGRGDRRVRQVDLRLWVSHAAGEVAVGCAQ